MLNALIESALNNRFLVLAGTLLVAGLGLYSAAHLPIDAVPDIFRAMAAGEANAAVELAPNMAGPPSTRSRPTGTTAPRR